MHFKTVGIALIAAALYGCASHTGIVPMGNGAYMVSKQAATGFPGLGNMKAEIIAEASAYCLSRGKEFQILGARETSPPYVLGNYPRSEITFTCTGSQAAPEPKAKPAPTAGVDV